MAGVVVLAALSDRLPTDNRLIHECAPPVALEAVPDIYVTARPVVSGLTCPACSTDVIGGEGRS